MYLFVFEKIFIFNSLVNCKETRCNKYIEFIMLHRLKIETIFKKYAELLCSSGLENFRCFALQHQGMCTIILIRAYHIKYSTLIKFNASSRHVVCRMSYVVCRMSYKIFYLKPFTAAIGYRLTRDANTIVMKLQ